MRIPNKYLATQTVRVVEREVPTAAPAPHLDPAPSAPDAQLEALRLENSMLRAQLANIAAKPVAYEFTFIRNSDGFLDKVVATPLKD